MKTIVYESVNHQAVAQNHFLNAEQKMIELFPGMEKAYSTAIDGWNLTLECYGEKTEINLMYTCLWDVQKVTDRMAVIQFEYDGKKKELLFARPIISDEKIIEFVALSEL